MDPLSKSQPRRVLMDRAKKFLLDQIDTKSLERAVMILPD